MSNDWIGDDIRANLLDDNQLKDVSNYFRLTHSRKLCKVFAGIALVCVVVGVGIGFGVYYGRRCAGSCLGSYQSESTLGVFNKYAVSTDSQPCANIGKEILEENGNAMDSMIAVLLCMGVTIPESMGLGGGALILIYNTKTNKSFAINSREKAPAAAYKDMYKDKGFHNSVDGPLAIAVPGELHGYWHMFKDHGSGNIKWSRLFEGAIGLCETGFDVSEHLATALDQKKDYIRNHTDLKAIYINPISGDVYKKGEKMVQKTLGQTLRAISQAVDPIKYYYEELSQIIVDDIKNTAKEWDNTDPIITVDDFKAYQPIITEAVLATFAVTNKEENITLHSFPLPGSGDILGFIMNVMQRFPDMYPKASDFVDKSALFYHRLIETYKYAFAKRSHLEDSETQKVKDVLNKLRSNAFADKVMQTIDDSKTFPSDSDHYDKTPVFMSEDHGTAHASVVDSFGNAVAVTTTVNSYFGSKVLSSRTGILLNNQMDDFNTLATNDFGIRASDSNFVTPGRRPLSSMCPTVFTDNNGLRLVIGGSGGPKITTAVASVSMRNLWFGETIKEAIDGPRVHHQLFADQIVYEKNFPQHVLTRLENKRHSLKRLADGDRGAIIMAISRENGKLYANSDYRKGGTVAGL